MTDQLLDDKDLDLSPDLMCLVLHRRSRIAAMAAASSRTTAVGDVVESPTEPLLVRRARSIS